MPCLKRGRLLVLKDYFAQLKSIRISHSGPTVENTIAMELISSLAPAAKIQPVDLPQSPEPKCLTVTVVRDLETWHPVLSQDLIFSSPDWIYFHVDEKLQGWLLSSRACFLYLALTYVQENFLDQNVPLAHPWKKEMAFAYDKSTFDLFLTQYARMIRNFERELYIREYARLGFTHMEVNALAGPKPLEPGIAGEFYPDFYTYCPALDQFVSSRLNQGIYPEDYLSANLARLKENAALADKYGLIPGLLCFEPRSVPEELLDRYPTLRGARVDHPFRSFKPRYNLSILHPVVREHYAELLNKVMEAVPKLGFLSIWTNDSGAGFEHTKSLYVGRNGGAYMIREWKDDAEIAQAAANAISGFFEHLRDMGRRINPSFRILTRLESFYGEYEYLWPQIRDGIDIELNSHLAIGWESPYSHPEYPDTNVLGSALHNNLKAEEKAKIDELSQRSSNSFFYHMLGSHTNHEPILGIPFPWLTYEKLAAAYGLGISHLAHVGGIHPADKVPFAVNQEVFRLFQLDPERNIEEMVTEIAQRYVGLTWSKQLIQAWRYVDEAIRSFPPLSIYTHYGVVWQRLFIRPLVSDIAKIPESERAYYEDNMCASIHNPNRIDLAQDVLFDLITPDYAHKAFHRIDESVTPPLESALDLFEKLSQQASRSGDVTAGQVFRDQSFRVRALFCLFACLKNMAVWIYAVHTYLQTNETNQKEQMRQLLEEMMDQEISNCEKLLDLWETAPVEWMIVSGGEETPFIYGDNFGELLNQKIRLMKKYRHNAPAIDPDYMFRIPDSPY